MTFKLEIPWFVHCESRTREQWWSVSIKYLQISSHHSKKNYCKPTYQSLVDDEFKDATPIQSRSSSLTTASPQLKSVCHSFNLSSSPTTFSQAFNSLRFLLRHVRPYHTTQDRIWSLNLTKIHVWKPHSYSIMVINPRLRFISCLSLSIITVQPRSQLTFSSNQSHPRIMNLDLIPCHSMKPLSEVVICMVHLFVYQITTRACCSLHRQANLQWRKRAPKELIEPWNPLLLVDVDVDEGEVEVKGLGRCLRRLEWRPSNKIWTWIGSRMRILMMINLLDRFKPSLLLLTSSPIKTQARPSDRLLSLPLHQWLHLYQKKFIPTWSHFPPLPLYQKTFNQARWFLLLRILPTSSILLQSLIRSCFGILMVHLISQKISMFGASGNGSRWPRWWVIWIEITIIQWTTFQFLKLNTDSISMPQVHGSGFLELNPVITTWKINK